jgi:ligand-binding sensor protein
MRIFASDRIAKFMDFFKWEEGMPIEHLMITKSIETAQKRVEDALNKRLVALTEPLESSDISFTDLFNIDDIQEIQDTFCEATGVASLITTPDGTPITRPSNFSHLCNNIIRKTEKGLANCHASDAAIGRPNPGGPVIMNCLSGGLCNAGSSIIVGGKHVANWLIGQVKNENTDEEKLLLYAREIGADEEAFRRALSKIPVMKQEQFERNAHFLFLLANELSLKAYQNVQQARFISLKKRAENELQAAYGQLYATDEELRMQYDTLKKIHDYRQQESPPTH